VGFGRLSMAVDSSKHSQEDADLSWRSRRVADTQVLSDSGQKIDCRALKRFMTPMASLLTSSSTGESTESWRSVNDHFGSHK
jgi:hypothetical protein